MTDSGKNRPVRQTGYSFASEATRARNGRLQPDSCVTMRGISSPGPTWFAMTSRRKDSR